MIDNLIYIHKLNIEWGREVDKKANIVLVISIAVVGFVLDANVLSISKSCVETLMSILFIIVSILSIYFVIRIIKPKLKNSKGSSIIYFQDLANNILKEDDLCKKIAEQTSDDFKDDLIYQITATASVTKRKFDELNTAVIFLIVQIAIGLMMFI